MSPSRISGAALTVTQQRWLLAASFVVLGGFALSTLVAPDPRGFGTHQQWGLPPCSFRVLFDIPCPSCGGTTCMAHFVRGQWPSALQANAAVFVLALACALFVPWSWISCRRGECLALHYPVHTLLFLAIGIAILAALQWGIRVSSGG